MQTEDLIDVLPGSSNAGCEGVIAELRDSISESCGTDHQRQNLKVNENKLDVEVPGTADADVVQAGDGILQGAELDGGLMESSSVVEVTVEVKEVLSVVEDANCLNSGVQSENACVKEKSPIGRPKRKGSPVSDSLSGTKKARIMVDEQQPSVKVMFNFLTRDSKRKLEELLQQWSEWHAKHRSSSHDPSDVLHSGERTYFPALHIGPSDSSAVSVWMDNHIGCQHNTEITPIESKSVPLYDRGYSWALTSTDFSNNLEGGLEMIDSSRCFNCGAYDHALKECPKPRDNAAVNSARKEHNSKRNLNANSRNPTRYYQNSSSGKYDGLKPGALDTETRKLLGLGELDPPPWLNRMREIGYPPGYLDPDDEDQPSGILIFGDEEHKEETEDGEILDTDFPEPPRIISTDPPRKMSVQFPGINAPIPENASESQWSPVPSSSDFYINRSQNANYFSERSTYREQRWSRDIKNEGHSTSRYNDLDSSYSFQREGGIIYATLVNPSSERSFSDRGRWSPSAHDDSLNHGSYNSRQSSPPNRLFSSQSYGSGSSRRWDDDRRNDSYSSRHRDRDRDDSHHPYRRR